VKLYGDLETFSATPIKNGTYRYAEDAEVLLFAYAIDDGPVACWDWTTCAPIPDALADALQDPACEIVFHNSMFDRAVLNHAWPEWTRVAPLSRWRDTMVKALAHSLPGSLDALCEIFVLPQEQRKQKIGKQLVQLFCKPRPKNSKLTRATRETHPVEWQQFIEYCKADVNAMRSLDQTLPTWNYEGDELQLWHLDQAINDRGVAVDLELAHGAIKAVELERKRLNARTSDITKGDVSAATQRDKMLAHILGAYGVALPDMQMSTLERRVQDTSLPVELRELLAIRLSSTTTSTSKYNALVRGTNNDGRLRGTLQFNGASRTGRWAGRVFQPQNLPRPSMKHDDIELGISAIKAGAADLVFDDVMRLSSSAIRGALIAPPGKKLVISDLSNIEGRDQAWLAGEHWKLAAFRQFDTFKLDEHGARIPDGKGDFLRMGPDMYKLAYAKSFGISSGEVDKTQRQVGKVQELALGYEGGVGAFLTFSLVYGIDLEDLADRALAGIPGDVLQEAEKMLAWYIDQGRDTFGLSSRAFIACDSLKRMWRRAHPEITSLWRDLGDTVREAIANPGQEYFCRKLTIDRERNWLRIRLPSGRCLSYPAPHVSDAKITYMGVDQYTRKWSRQATYGGKLFENVCQGVARDVMTANMPAIEAAGYQIVLTVHDEVITEAPDSPEFNAEHLSSLLSSTPAWAKGMPLAAAGFETYRYRKE
jgi:DNA polymerase